jgi:hypothetical protein
MRVIQGQRDRRDTVLKGTSRERDPALAVLFIAAVISMLMMVLRLRRDIRRRER